MPTRAECEAAVAAAAKYVRNENAYFGEKENPKQFSGLNAAAKDLDTNVGTLQGILSAASTIYGLTPHNYAPPQSSYDPTMDLPDPEEVLKRHGPVNTSYIQNFKRQMTQIIPVSPEPFAVAFVGDPHLDNKGTDLEALQKDLNFIRGTGMRAVNMGDVLDNFHHTGKLSKKQAQNGVSEDEGLSLAKWFLTSLRWDAHILGNHDKWAGGPYAHLFTEWSKPAPLFDWYVRLQYTWEGGQYIVDVAHDFKGNSMNNPTHAQARRAKEDGVADAYVAAHRHEAADASFENGFRGKKYRFMRVAGYKKADSYGNREKGYAMQAEGSSGVLVIDPQSESMDGMCRTFMDLGDAARYYQMLKR
ncbi:MAG: hypothetical protein AAFR21_14950 [Pseudomonadota bacterium]